ncbi:tetraacyldisaccharide 4'-kinase [Xylophilus ampelinus]|uniref:Tetraacyldisaccharide 4'-kinase n=1 Tax=Xylophilus ampelinus TaxID=54067 RepID=A0A318SPR7_9BURK|nr:tetraacyldisaccharide 4'-kinase [Xylophilus ampelinus]MCS4508851.1 tetraacyldisaccharide 4'-kinase [Xylophilus ampelinus]PYE79422.1 lipid-A-disaccharide kinase [Xylophilus ampelinus]
MTPGGGLRERLQDAWLKRGPLAWSLRPASWVYRALWNLRLAAYRRGWRRTERVGVPLIVVGNVVAGGAGKTPTVIAVVEHLQRRGLRVGVVSRGYGRALAAAAQDDIRAVLPQDLPQVVGDEPLLIRRRTGAPVFVGSRRAATARRLLAAHPEVQLIVCDDGLQHLALGRDIEICVFDDRGVGNGWPLPAGPLREPWPRPVDLVLHTGTRPAFAGYRGARRLADHALQSDGTVLPLTALAGVALHAVAGIARPEAFFSMLRDRGLAVAQATALPDHYHFDSWRPASDAGQRLVCTEKDAPKLWQAAPDALAVPLVFVPEPAFLASLDERVDARLARLSSPAHDAAQGKP